MRKKFGGQHGLSSLAGQDGLGDLGQNARSAVDDDLFRGVDAYKLLPQPEGHHPQATPGHHGPFFSIACTA
ncbi:hypothetical protein [Paenibacillus spongiae]|uniref:Uncharacterized protein n=1 Tax=Paenibacillus spongiae TaxID=2909671 RepID=A0ABY5S983_9BACL|nr:hypothetical protein [Paenibacillus spongiae]UVI30482.1 hypothetical protein L1F29_00895 [Paenibacillus spongiae]